MSDLISRSILLKELKKAEDDLTNVAEQYNFSGGVTSAMLSVYTIINKMPTAYDIDKVIEELEKREEHYVEMLDWQRQMAIVDAIGIAKQGGVADDCCEWKQSESFMAIRTYNIGCCDRTLDLTVRMSEEMKYCPYCGKKIKVVE